MPGSEVERRLAAILAADVAGYSRMMGADEAGTLVRLKAHLGEVVRPAIAAHRGNVVKTTGDGLLGEFPSVVAAVECAVEIQRAMAERNTREPEDCRIRFRIGINLGDIIVDDGDIFGDGVNIAARLEGLAEPGGICVHRDVKSQVESRLPLVFDDMGEVAVKNIARPLRVYSVRLDGSKAPKSAPRQLTGSRLWRAAGLSLFLIAILAVVGGISYRSGWTPVEIFGGGAKTKVASDKPSIAVLPFANLSHDAEQDYFADGLTEDLTTQLSSISKLFVIARTSVLTYKDKAARPQDVAHDLGVRYVLEGSVRKLGDQVRVNTDLVDTEDAQQLWAKQYDRKLDDIFALQDEVIGEVAAALSLPLSEVEKERIARVPTDNLEAYDYYLRGETEGYYKNDIDTFGRALDFYANAIRLDPKFADAYAGYARVAVEVWRLEWDVVMPAAMARKRAYDAASKALELDPDNARAYTALAMLQLTDGRYEEATQSARKAVSLAPSDPEARANLGAVLAYSGQHEEAKAAIEQALQLNPAAPPGFRLLAGLVFYLVGEYDRAATEFEAVRDAWPVAQSPHVYLAAIYALRGQVDMAKSQLATLPHFPFFNLAATRMGLETYMRKDDLERHLQLLKKAGMPEWPFGFAGRPEDRVTGDDLTKLVSSGKWAGNTPLGDNKNAAFIMQIDREDRVAYGSANTFLTGVVRIQSDQLCMQFDGYKRDRWLCGSIYRTNGSTLTGAHEDYVYVLADGLRYFSPET